MWKIQNETGTIAMCHLSCCYCWKNTYTIILMSKTDNSVTVQNFVFFRTVQVNSRNVAFSVSLWMKPGLVFKWHAQPHSGLSWCKRGENTSWREKAVSSRWQVFFHIWIAYRNDRSRCDRTEWAGRHYRNSLLNGVCIYNNYNYHRWEARYVKLCKAPVDMNVCVVMMTVMTGY